MRALRVLPVVWACALALLMLGPALGSGFVHTKMTEGRAPAPLSVTPEQVADAVTDAVASGDDLIWVPGAMRGVMSGLRHVPRALFRRLPI